MVTNLFFSVMKYQGTSHLVSTSKALTGIYLMMMAVIRQSLSVQGSAHKMTSLIKLSITMLQVSNNMKVGMVFLSYALIFKMIMKLL